jgi:2-polyprenyl-6-hydroxyphenyl methylase/3-demethylubiquinone-9 3-methyltransferase
MNRPGPRFAFGANWASFLGTLDEDRIREAEHSLRETLEVPDLAGRTFLDIGSGSGLFSLAARRLGARVRSFDFDPRSVACTAELRRRFFPDDPDWTVEPGSVLDAGYVASLGRFDVVYSWGVLHHTGDLWRAFRNALVPLAPGGLLFIAIYNDQGRLSRFWRSVKRTYCSGPLGKAAVSAVFIPLLALRSLVAGTVRHGHPLGQLLAYRRQRGMSLYHDWIDWLGGYPFEVASPGLVVRHARDAGLELRNLVTTNRNGCNQFVFRKPS